MLPVMIHRAQECILLGFAVMLLNAGGDAAQEKLSISCKDVTLVDRIDLKCITPPTSDWQCSFYVYPLNSTKSVINVTQSRMCEQQVNGSALLSAEALQLLEVWNVVNIFCTMSNGAESIESQCETVTVWRISIQMSYLIIGLVAVGCLSLLSLTFLCIICIISVPINGTRSRTASPKTRCTTQKSSRVEHNLSCEEDSAPEDNKDEKEAAEDDVCYATVIYPDVTENSVHAIRFGQKTEYAVVVINTVDSN
ncbi:uncharacterized protein [Salminus brasiliensis]|uniref:uncharacterized protein isoform X2 n=1 Tax=Salminus brasiliensis TaxID=930266 RepID=UPI003B82F3B7